MKLSRHTLGLSLLALVAATAARGQLAQWAKPDDPTAKFIIDSERQWAEAACTHNHIAANVLADDFLGTSPEGSRYTMPGCASTGPSWPWDTEVRVPCTRLPTAPTSRGASSGRTHGSSATESGRL